MTFYVRAWFSNGNPIFLNSNTELINSDISNVEGYDEKYDLVVEGEYMYSDQVLEAISLSDGAVSIEGRHVLAQSEVTHGSPD